MNTQNIIKSFSIAQTNENKRKREEKKDPIQQLATNVMSSEPGIPKRKVMGIRAKRRKQTENVSHTPENRSVPNINNHLLPEEILFQIFFKVDYKTGLSVQLACKDFYRICRDPNILRTQIFDFILDEALNAIAKIPVDFFNKQKKTTVLCAIVESLLRKKDLQKSRWIIEKINDSQTHLKMLIELVKVEIGVNPKASIQPRLDEMFFLIDSTNSSSKYKEKFKALIEIANVQVEENREGALQTIEMARNYTISAYGKTRPRSDRLEEIIAILCKINLESAFSMIKEIEENHYKAKALIHIVREMAKGDPESAINFAKKYFDSQSNELFAPFFPPRSISLSYLIMALSEIANIQIERDKEIASKALQEALKIIDSRQFDELIDIISILAKVDPELALSKVELIGYAYYKAKTYFSIALAQAEINKDFTLKVLNKCIVEINFIPMQHLREDLLKEITLLKNKLEGNSLFNIEIDFGHNLYDTSNSKKLISKAAILRQFNPVEAAKALKQAFQITSVLLMRPETGLKEVFVEIIKEMSYLSFQEAYNMSNQLEGMYKAGALCELAKLKAKINTVEALRIAFKIDSAYDRALALAWILGCDFHPRYTQTT